MKVIEKINHKILSVLVGTLLLLTISPDSIGQKSTYKGFPSLTWPKLYSTTFVKASDKLGDYDKPVFTDVVKALNGKTITLPGYMIPFENGMKGNHFMFSSMPINACFFCGVGGPETVIEAFSKQTVTYTEKPLEIRGTLKLNDKNPDQMVYVLENVEIIGEAGL